MKRHTLAQYAHEYAYGYEYDEEEEEEEDQYEQYSELVSQLNELLHSLRINLSIPIESPTDLTPSLLIAILQSLIGVRIPLHDFAVLPSPSSPTSSKMDTRELERIQTVKIFLGVLEHDVLRTDVGLSDIDPRRLARGDWDEVVSVAEVLCWVGKKVGLVRDSKKAQIKLSGNVSTPPPHPHATQPSPSLLSNDLSPDINMNANFKSLPAPSTCCTDDDDELEYCTTPTPTPLPRVSPHFFSP
ncbi:hypothetical protein AMATHDRAFT_61098 [Amanita thiersii Skay4041]|uniref:DUF5745 domain-containing protein n=1 Tax=Amanita thiersii Skay4041 TaxID=703135 RepID=A0A2A9NII7_9AGAR|nr:hypothetical protein AMATHDRAFT_61098 [Amanita thiersii Skay4041]